MNLVKNRRFPGFGLVDGRDIARAREDFCRSLVDVPIQMSQRSPRIWISWKKRGFPGFSSIRSTGIVQFGRQFWVYPYDFCKNAGFSGFGSMDLRVIAASVREFRRCAVDHPREKSQK